MKFNKIEKTKRSVLAVLLTIGLLSLNSCDNDFGDINNGFEAKVQDATISGLFNSLIESIKKEETRNRVPVSWLYQWNQQAAMYTASGFRLDDKTSQAWENYYRTLANYHDIENLIAAEENPASFTNIQAMSKIVIAYKSLTTTLLYGDIPYSEAGQGFTNTDLFRPIYESQQSVMEAAINELTWAIDNLSTSATQESLGSGDTLLGNDIALWIKFANSLRLRYAMVMVDKNPTFANPIISDALGKPLLTADEHVSLDPATIPNLKNEKEGFYKGNSYIRMGSTMWEAMSITNAVDGSGIYDLRCSILFEPNADDEWVPYPQNPDGSTPTVTGLPYENTRIDEDWNEGRSNFASLNVYYVHDDDLPQFILTGTQISFLKAEIYNRGLAGIASDLAMSESNYNEGITASVNFWYNRAFNSWIVNKPPAAAPTAPELDAMLTNLSVAYSGDQATALSQIYKQSWVSLFHQPFEAWNLQRRTNNGTPNVPLSATSLVNDFNRLTYPPSERETNRVNWSAATGGGSDSETTKIWIQQ